VSTITPRIGPRPLPLHLTAAISAFASSQAMLPLLKRGLLAWRPELKARGAELERSLAGVELKGLARAVAAEVGERAQDLIVGIERYRNHPYRRDLADPPMVWCEGSSRLLDYGVKTGGAAVLVIPSLINRSYILDLMKEKSLLRYLAAQGLRPLLLDWGEPGAIERAFDLTDYVAGRLERALDHAVAMAESPVAVIGYCMGGNLALALALRRASEIRALALLATPWDFHAERPEQGRLLGALAPQLGHAFRGIGELPVDVLQTLFAALDPLLALRKFARFAAFDPVSPAAREFVALEDWLNDGVPLSLPVALDCLGEWYGTNATALGTWRVAERAILPEALALPALVVVPAQDRIVPPGSARALAERIEGAELLAPALGHIGMVVSKEAPSLVWGPLSQWLLRPRSKAARRLKPKAQRRQRARR